MKAKILSFFRKPKQPEISMTRLMELVALVKKLIDALAAARAEVISLKSDLLACEIQADKDEATIAELMSVIDGAIGDAGGSVGGNKEIN